MLDSFCHQHFRCCSKWCVSATCTSDSWQMTKWPNDWLSAALNCWHENKTAWMNEASFSCEHLQQFSFPLDRPTDRQAVAENCAPNSHNFLVVIISNEMSTNWQATWILHLDFDGREEKKNAAHLDVGCCETFCMQHAATVKQQHLNFWASANML